MCSSVLIDRSVEDPSARPARDEEWELALRDLSERQRATVSLYYRHGLELKQIGTAFGLSEGRISQILKETIGLLRASGNYRVFARN